METVLPTELISGYFDEVIAHLILGMSWPDGAEPTEAELARFAQRPQFRSDLYRGWWIQEQLRRYAAQR